MRVWPEAFPDDELTPLAHADIEVASRESVAHALAAIQPALVINTSAFHKVDIVEDEADRAFAVNAIGVRNLGLECRQLDCVLMHMSTDYVFSGESATPYVESDPVGPVNVYGSSKAAGEMLLRHTWKKHFIVRTTGLYGVAGSSGKGGNFVETMLRLATQGKPIRVVDDQVLTPTSTMSLARQLAALAETDAYGTYHATCQGECSWYGFASEIFKLAGVEVELSPQTTAESGAKAARPAYSVLDNRALEELGIDRMPDWRESLAGYLQERRDRAGVGKAS